MSKPIKLAGPFKARDVDYDYKVEVYFYTRGEAVAWMDTQSKPAKKVKGIKEMVTIKPQFPWALAALGLVIVVTGVAFMGWYFA